MPLLAQTTFGPDHFWPDFGPPKWPNKVTTFGPLQGLTTFGPPPLLARSRSDHFWPTTAFWPTTTFFTDRHLAKPSLAKTLANGAAQFVAHVLIWAIDLRRTPFPKTTLCGTPVVLLCVVVVCCVVVCCLPPASAFELALTARARSLSLSPVKDNGVVVCCCCVLCCCVLPTTRIGV